MNAKVFVASNDFINLKEEPELRHILSHLWLALWALTCGRKGEAKVELKSIESLIFYKNEEEQNKIGKEIFEEEVEYDSDKWEGTDPD